MSLFLKKQDFCPGQMRIFGIGTHWQQNENIKLHMAEAEPEIYAMLVAGLGLMGFVARRRQRNGAAA